MAPPLSEYCGVCVYPFRLVYAMGPFLLDGESPQARRTTEDAARRSSKCPGAPLCLHLQIYFTQISVFICGCVFGRECCSVLFRSLFCNYMSPPLTLAGPTTPPTSIRLNNDIISTSTFTPTTARQRKDNTTIQSRTILATQLDAPPAQAGAHPLSKISL